MKEFLTSGKLAKEAGVNKETIRFYERKGLINKPPRKLSGYRMFPPDTVSRIRFIKRAQQLGFSLKEISELLSLRYNPKTSCAKIREKAKNKLQEIDLKVKHLLKIKNELQKITDACIGKGDLSKCSIILAFEKDERR